MSVTLRSMIIAAALIITAALLYKFSNISGQISTDEINERYPSFEATKLSGEVFDATGQIKYAIYGDLVTYYKNKELISISKPVGFYYDQKGSDQPFGGWQIRADKAEVVRDSHANLVGNILILPNFATAEVKEISTPYLHFDMVKNTLSSADELQVKGDQFINAGSNYIVDLNAKTIVIKENPHAVYYPHPVDLSSNRP